MLDLDGPFLWQAFLRNTKLIVRSNMNSDGRHVFGRQLLLCDSYTNAYFYIVFTWAHSSSAAEVPGKSRRDVGAATTTTGSGRCINNQTGCKEIKWR